MPFFNITIREIWREKSVYDLLYHVQAPDEEAARAAVAGEFPVGDPVLVDRDVSSSEFAEVVSVEETGPFQTGVRVQTNADRADAGRRAIEASTDVAVDHGDASTSDAVREYAADAIANVLHAVREAGFDTDATVRRAVDHFDAEVDDELNPAEAEDFS